jgi:hypothetical protein
MPNQSRILTTVGHPYTEEQLQRYVNRWPDDIELVDGALYSKKEILDDAHRKSWKVTIKHWINKLDQEEQDRPT